MGNAAPTWNGDQGWLKQEHKVSYRHRHCRRDPNDYKAYCIEVLQVLASEFSSTLGRSFRNFLRKLRKFLPKSKKTLKLKTCRIFQAFVILGSLLQWRWQWASIGHFVFLLFTPVSSAGFWLLKSVFWTLISENWFPKSNFWNLIFVIGNQILEIINQISLQKMLIAFDNEIRFQSSDFRIQEPIPRATFLSPPPPLAAAAFFLKISLLEMLIAFGNDIRFQKTWNQISEIIFQKSDFRHQC